MAQATKSSNARSSSSTKRRASGSKSSANGRSTSSRSRTSSRSQTRNGSTASKAASSKAKRTTSGAASKAAATPGQAAKEAASAGTKAAGKAIAAGAAKLKRPALVTGAAAAGVIGGVALKQRVDGSRSKGMRARLSRATPNLSLPKPGKPRLPKGAKLDLDGVSKTAQKVGSYGRQVDEVARAVQRASESAKKGK